MSTSQSTIEQFEVTVDRFTFQARRAGPAFTASQLGQMVPSALAACL